MLPCGPTLSLPCAAVRNHALSFACLAAVLFLLRGLAFLTVLPPFEGWDEYQHYARIVHEVETGVLPELGRDRVPESLAPVLVGLAHDPGSVSALSGRGARGYRKLWESGPATYRDDGRPLVMLWQAQQAPLYYRLARPLYLAAGGLDHPLRSYTWLRCLNVLFGTAAVYVGARLILRIGGGQQLAQLAVLGLALHPEFLQNCARVGNDAPAVFLGVLVLAFALVERPIGLAGAALGGACLGFACLVKSTNLVLVPLLPLALACRARPEEAGRSRAWLRAGAALGACLLVLGPWHAHLYQLYGTPTGMAEAWENRRAGRTSADVMRSAQDLSWLWFWRRQMLMGSLWQGGWSFLWLPHGLRQAYAALLGFAVVGWALWLVRGARATLSLLARWQVLALACLCASLFAALSYNAAESRLVHGGPLTCPWYAMVALPAFVLLVAEGWNQLPLGRRSSIPAGLMVLLLLGTELWGSYAVIAPHVTGGAAWPEWPRRLAALNPALPWMPLGAAAQIAALLLAAWLVLRACRAAPSPA